MNPSADPAPNSIESTFGLSDEDIREFRQICREEGVALDEHEAADRARAVLTLYRLLLGPIPEDPSVSQEPLGSNVVPLSSLPSGKVD